MFADDTIIISINYYYEEMMKNLQKDFDMVSGWLIDNELYISEEKTVQLNITVPKMKMKQDIKIISHSEKCSSMIGGEKCKITCKKIECKTCTKYLGIEIDDHWNFKEHISKLTSKLRQIIPKLYNVKYILNSKNKKILYDAWVESLLRYGIEVFGFASEYMINRLQRIQNKIVKVLFGNDNAKTNDLFINNNILKVIDIRNLVIIIKNYYINTHKNYDKSKGERLRKNTMRYDVPLWNNTYGLRNKTYYIPHIFNKLDDSLLNQQGKGPLKTLLKRDLIKNYERK